MWGNYPPKTNLGVSWVAWRRISGQKSKPPDPPLWLKQSDWPDYLRQTNWSLKKSPITKTRRPTQGEIVPPLPSTNLTRSRTPLVQRMTPAKMQEMRSCGLCFNCDEKFILGHRCRKLFMIEDLYSRDEYGEEDDFTELEGTATEELIISLHAITGSRP